jgi:anti-sigma B factor antagonist
MVDGICAVARFATAPLYICLRQQELMDPFAVTTTQDHGQTVIAVRGELDLATCGKLTAALDDALRDASGAAIRVDLSELTFCDSSGLKALLQASRQAELRRVGLVMTRPPQASWRVFEVSGLGGVLPFVQDAAGAPPAPRSPRSGAVSSSAS